MQEIKIDLEQMLNSPYFWIVILLFLSILTCYFWIIIRKVYHWYKSNEMIYFKKNFDLNYTQDE